MKKDIHNFKVVKVIELALYLVLEILFLIILISNKTLRSSVFVDRSLFILCMIMYFTTLLGLGFLIYDFIRLRLFKKESHELENLAFLDSKTGIPNRNSVNIFSENYKTEEDLKGLACVLTEIANIRDINEKNGKAVGDRVITDFSKIYETSAEGIGFVARNGGNEFITVIEKCTVEKLDKFKEKLSANIENYNKTNGKCTLEIHSECVSFDSEEVSSFSDLVANAYRKLGR